MFEGNLDFETVQSGLITARCVESNENGLVRIRHLGLADGETIAARFICQTAPKVGEDVAVMFDGGDCRKPIIIGPVKGNQTLAVQDNEEVFDFTERKHITLRCGKASITLTKEGKIILRGTYISSRSSGANRIKGGSVHLN